MKSENNYSSVADGVLSVTRLLDSLSQNRLAERFSVGGRIGLHDGRMALISRQGLLLLPQDLECKIGDLAVLDASCESLEKRDSMWVLNKVDRLQTVVSSRRSPPRFEFSQATAELWSEFLLSTRVFFSGRGLLEVTTPYLVSNPGMEPELEPFSTHWRSGSKARVCYLPTSPELHLKQMLAHGFTDIFEIKTAFRNEELTPLHQPEFNMIEWYRGFSNLKAIERDLFDYIEHLARVVFKFEKPVPKLEQHTVAELFAAETNFVLQPFTTRLELFELANTLGLKPVETFDWNDLFHLIWVAKIESTLPEVPFLLCDYPPSQAALARINDRGWADRFEFYWQGYEIANAFHELNDPIEQRHRFERDQKKRAEYGRTPLEIDESFMSALEYGLPPSSGIALGLDRLFMAFTGIKQISKTRAFTFYC
ncbi:MAG: EF-P lysine aminoacylase GenX [Bdellovibrionales bacterium]|nr:EF-P lysine aminoacylase GenX [Bdellovibrionales bacterium]